MTLAACSQWLGQCLYVVGHIPSFFGNYVSHGAEWNYIVEQRRYGTLIIEALNIKQNDESMIFT